MNETILMSGRYRHYKGQDYQVFNVVRHSETNEKLVVYRCLYDDYSLWVRPYSMFLEMVDVDGEQVPRFTFMESMDESFPVL